MEENEELLKLQEELKDVTFACYPAPNKITIDNLREVKDFIDYVESKKEK